MTRLCILGDDSDHRKEAMSYFSVRSALQKTYSSKVNNETISFVEAGPSQGDFCGSHNSPSLDMQKPLSTQIISNNVIKSRGNTTCLNKTKQSSRLYFSLICANLPFWYRWGSRRGKKPTPFFWAKVTCWKQHWGTLLLLNSQVWTFIWGNRYHLASKDLQINGERENVRFTALSCIIQRMR